MIILMTNSKLLHNQATNQDQNITYYEALLAKENDLKVALAQIQSSIQQLNTTMAQVQNNPSIQVIALSDAMAEERYIL